MLLGSWLFCSYLGPYVVTGDCFHLSIGVGDRVEDALPVLLWSGGKNLAVPGIEPGPSTLE